MATTTRGLERLVFFTDAIAAIAITLLILPLVDLVPDVAAEGGTLGELLNDHAGALMGFVISFAVIARLWYSHHQLFEHVAAYTPRLVLLTVIWAFTIVLLPLPTSITAQIEPSRATVAFYIGTMAASSIVITVMTLLIRRDSRIEAPDNRVSDRTVAGSVSISIAFVVAFVLGVTIPHVNYWALFVLFLSGPVEAIVRRRLRRG
ncbi:TMEM175 family protein [Naasia sp. SYSU D00057]|uniref:TMEM175 family protein n=1 Tax=Naasia sp. SYSU D00057 TaxID=2817380 RepID=UPI001B305811|nr:TMEM175 family protein [Naasia sp. SYSU D00057]